ncbi:transporter [Burkholderia ubonensis]|uniref:BON domain-containing protein n=1 Tax=Burkholderia ubonensis TaxID=101571 RepID=UPI000752AB04|nr:BON domain-containing protein [Burkholderia ubonensis]KVM54714.1 transporter [Burkholderia ubonensis]
MRTLFKLVAVLLAAASWAACAHAQTGSASAVEPSPASVQAAESAALSPAQRKAADRKLKRRVSAALARARDLNATRILVRVRDGNVTLAGSVANAGQVERAAAVARQIAGVVSVTNLLRIDMQPL